MKSILVLFCLFTLPALAASNSSGCPTSTKNIQTANNVAANFSNNTTTKVTTYTFTSLINENPVNGVPGLVRYCVYPTPAATPTAHTVSYDEWLFRQDPSDFGFVRPNGNKSNVPLDDGTSHEMGTATWTDLPTDQTIILTSLTPRCAPASTVAPHPPASSNRRRTSVPRAQAQPSLPTTPFPFGGENCIPPSFGVEAYGFNELGDQVVLAGAARTLDSLKVLFTSYGCSVSGHWYSGDCVTTSGATFDVPITANIYDSSTCSGSPLVCSAAPIATVTTTQTIPYRPSASTTGPCAGTDPNGYADNSRWFNPLGNGGAGACQYSIGALLTFDFSSLNVTLPDNVVWTVAYNTSHSGYDPIASPLGPGDTCESSAGGCGYDSLNIGTKSYTGAPYAGTDVSESVIFLNWWQGNGVPQYPSPFGFGVLTPSVGIESTTDTINNTWIGLRPLGEIITK